MNCTSVCTSIRDIHTHTRTLHFIYIDSCTDILYYCTHLLQMNSTFVYTTSLVSVRLYCKFVPTNESPSKITLMNRVDQSQLRFLDIAPLHHLNCCMLTESFPKGNGRGKKESMPVCTPLEIPRGSSEHLIHLGNRYTRTHTTRWEISNISLIC
jgi:hypothetical protein